MPIKNIIFDFGDVFINLDKPATLRQMQPLGLERLTPEMDEINQKYEKGIVSTTEFIDYYQQLFPLAGKAELVKAWNAILLDFPRYRLDFLLKIAKSSAYRLFLWSNTNALHLEEVQNIMGRNMYDTFFGCFEKHYFSHELGMRKPEPVCFTSVLEEQNLNPADTLFIDDTEINTQSAAQHGLQVWHLIPGKADVVQLFDQTFFKKP